MADAEMQADLGNVGLASHRSEVRTVVSADGTRIAYERSGDGPPVVVIGGGLNDKAIFATLSELLSANFTVLNYDRRGRGDSDDGDPEQYTPDLEIEDLAAVVDAAGEPCFVFANCTGGMIAVPAAARGVPMVKLAVYEPPYAAPPVPDDFMSRLKKLIAEDRRAEAVVLFQRESVGFPEETIARFKQHPVWPTFEALAPTLVYDCILGLEQGATVPVDLLPRISVPTLVMDGGASPPWVHRACEALAGGIPDARHLRIEGEGHLFNQHSGAPLLTEFFLS